MRKPSVAHIDSHWWVRYLDGQPHKQNNIITSLADARTSVPTDWVWLGCSTIVRWVDIEKSKAARSFNHIQHARRNIDFTLTAMGYNQSSKPTIFHPIYHNVYYIVFVHFNPYRTFRANDRWCKTRVFVLQNRPFYLVKHRLLHAQMVHLISPN